MTESFRQLGECRQVPERGFGATKATNDTPAAAIDPSPEAKACRAAFEAVLRSAADRGMRAGNLYRLAREYRRTERRAKALEKILLPEVEDAIKRVDEQLDTMDREETIRTRWGRARDGIADESAKTR